MGLQDMENDKGRRSLPLVGEGRGRRADAVRNRRRVLEAAEGILAEKGVEGLLMNDVARAAGVGVGTLYRGFGDRAGLAYALLDELGMEFQAAMLHGPPPLGPGAAPVERIRAFLHSWLDHLEDAAELMLMGDGSKPMSRYRSGSYRSNRAHLVVLIREARPESDTEYMAESLLALLDADLYLHQRREMSMPPERIKAGVDELLKALFSA